MFFYKKQLTQEKSKVKINNSFSLDEEIELI